MNDQGITGLVAGFGRAGRRHARVLSELGCRVVVVSRHGEGAYRAVREALEEHRVTLVVVASETAEHASALEELADAGYRGDVLVEKPLFADVRPVPPNGFRNLWVAYDRRFHPAVVRARELLAVRPVISALFYVGQHLSQWRPGTDYHECYSASVARGGGALRDLSHELDLASWLLGGCEELVAAGVNGEHLGIQADEAYCVTARHERCRLSQVQLNYLDERVRRFFVLNVGDETIAADLVASTVEHDGVTESFPMHADDPCRAQLRAVLAGGSSDLCDAEQGLAVMRIIAACERSDAEKGWVRP